MTRRHWLDAYFRDENIDEILIEAIPDGVDPLEYMRQAMDDCPLCQEARARGEIPQTFVTLPIPHEPVPRYRFARRPRWRTRKRVIVN